MREQALISPKAKLPSPFGRGAGGEGDQGRATGTPMRGDRISNHLPKPKPLLYNPSHVKLIQLRLAHEDPC